MNFKHLAIGLLTLAAVSFMLLGSDYLPTAVESNQTAESSSDPASSQTQRADLSVAAHNHIAGTASQNALLDERLSEERIAELLEKHITPEMRTEINEMLNPSDHVYKEVKTERGGYIELGKRATSVTVAVIDDDGEMIITDLTGPLPAK